MEPITRPGDIWTLNNHRLICGDCRDPEVVARLLNGAKINVAFTSPPYASQRKYDESSGFKPIHPDEFVDWFEAVQANVRTHLANDGSWFVNIKEHCEDGERHLYVKDLTIAHKRRWGWRYIDEIVWTKKAVPGGYTNRFKNGWEPVFHFSCGDTIRFRPDSVAIPTVGNRTGLDRPNTAGSPFKACDFDWTGDSARPSNVLKIETGNVDGAVSHSATFPVGLPSFFIKAYSDEDDAIYDPFCGSGTVIIACERLNRRGYGCELSPKYCDVIIARWEKATGCKAERLTEQVDQ